MANFEVVNYEELDYENDENNAPKRRRLNYKEIERFPNEEAFQQWIQGTIPVQTFGIHHALYPKNTCQSLFAHHSH
jgi:hypothetical protein